MNLIDEVLSQRNLSYDDLTADEKQTLFGWEEALKKSQITIDRIRGYLSEMRDAVSEQISKEPTFIRVFIFQYENPQLIRLQARLRNYTLLLAFLSTPEKAREKIDEAIAGIAKGKQV